MIGGVVSWKLLKVGEVTNVTEFGMILSVLREEEKKIVKTVRDTSH
jgi:hypothetical protein